MSAVFVRGAGAVSPAGWGLEPFLAALRVGIEVPAQELRGPANGRVYRARMVPPWGARPSWLAHPRLRRASAISQFALAAGLEALQSWGPGGSGPARLGIVMGTHTGCIRYTERFYGEVLEHPSMASPMLFPETVANAPASHLAAFLGGAARCYSVLGDQTAFVQALRMACEWLADDCVEACLVVGVEEAAWPVADAIRSFSRGVILGEGAGALLLAREPGAGPRIALERITRAHRYSGAATKEMAARGMRRELGDGGVGEVLMDSRCGVGRMDGAETAAWADWVGGGQSPRRVLGEGLCAATGWQFVAAQGLLVRGGADAVCVSVVGGNEQAIGGRLVRTSA